MKKYRVIVTETQSYEVFVKAKNEKVAEAIALEHYGSEGVVFNTTTNVVGVEEDEE